MYMFIHPNKIEMMGGKTWKKIFGLVCRKRYILLSAFYYRTLIYIDFYLSNFWVFLSKYRHIWHNKNWWRKGLQFITCIQWINRLHAHIFILPFTMYMSLVSIPSMIDHCSQSLLTLTSLAFAAYITSWLSWYVMCSSISW